MTLTIDAKTAAFCYLDLEIDHHRRKLATAAAFVNSTDARYGFSSKDLRLLGGSEVSRISELISTDHEWSTRAASDGIEIKPPASGNRIVLKLFWHVAPLACENFATLCANGSLLAGKTAKKTPPAPQGESGKPLTYRTSIVHRIVPGFVVQGGDIIFGNGSGGESIFGKKFKDERAGLNLKHDRRGVLSMGNSGKNSNTSQWFLTFRAAPQCDGKHVIFGEILSGWEVLDEVEAHGSASGEPKVAVEVTDCGVWAPFHSPGSGYWFDQPDEDAFSGISPVFMVKPRVAVVAPSQAVIEKFHKVMVSSCSLLSVTIDDPTSESSKVQEIKQLLEAYRVDVIVVAPACRNLVELVALPFAWTTTFSVDRDAVIIESKPMDVLENIHAKSWLTKRTKWQLAR